MMEQYARLKDARKDAILMFRLGDFFEMFFDDAIVASKALGIALTGRDNGRSERMPMCGVPAHAVDGYVAKLVEAGHVVALADQVEDAKLAKGIVRREIVKVVTPGTVTDAEMLEAGRNNYIAAVFADEGRFHLAHCDVTTGDFAAVSFDSGSAGSSGNCERALLDELSRLAPAEILFPEGCPFARKLDAGAKKTTLVPEWTFGVAGAHKSLCAHFGTFHLEGFGLGAGDARLAPLGALHAYLGEYSMTPLSQLTKIRLYSAGDKMQLDYASRRNLELTHAGQDREFCGSLLWALDRARTAMGKRLLRAFVESPLVRPDEINRRLDCVEEWAGMPLERAELRECLSEIGDMERLIARISAGSQNPRDMAALGAGAAFLPAIQRLLKFCRSDVNAAIFASFDALGDVHGRISRTLVDAPPPSVGGAIRDGVSDELDRLREARRGAEGLLLAMEERERKRTGIGSLKIRFNKVFGYYIEVSKANLAKVPPDFARKQTLAAAERYTTKELSELEAALLGGDERMAEIELAAYEELRGFVASQTARVQFMAASVAALDALGALAAAAEEHGYVRPVVNGGDRIAISEGRHPIVELLRDDSFIPNGTCLGGDGRLMVITGPNMAGKSTYMRQVALIVLMAQIGSFVPAASAEIGAVDRIFTRVGASDDLATGQSTFMVEMTEVANIMNSATEKSLILLDEIGRGTSTYDGLSIAWACLEHIADKIRAKTLFATHYHELSSLEGAKPGVRNYSFGAKEHGRKIVFTRKLEEGAAGRSYGIHVARLAGIPKEALARALQVQGELAGRAPRAPEPASGAAEAPPPGHAELAELAEVDTDSLAPLAALLKLKELSEKAREALRGA